MGFTFAGDDNVVTVQFGQHSIGLILKDEGGTITLVRELARKQKQAERAAERMELLSRRASEAADQAEYDKLNADIETLAKGPDGATLMVDMIMAAAKGWKDVFANKAAEEVGETLPFNRENLERLPLKGLVKITEQIVKHLGLTDDDSGEAAGSLPERSPQAEPAPGSSLSGTETSRPTAP